jgi:hypothetical protein
MADGGALVTHILQHPAEPPGNFSSANCKISFAVPPNCFFMDCGMVGTPSNKALCIMAAAMHHTNGLLQKRQRQYWPPVAGKQAFVKARFMFLKQIDNSLFA